MREVLRNRQLPYVFVVNSVAYPSVVTIAGLWGGPYLSDVHGLGPVERGNVLLIMTLGMVVGHLTYGRLDRVFDTRKWLIVFGSLSSLVLFVLLASVPALTLWQVTVVFTLLGMLTSYSSLITTHGRAIFPEHLVGRGMTTNNMSVFLGAAAFQWLSGWVIGLHAPMGSPPPIAAYQAMFAVIGGIHLVSVLIYLRARDVKPSQERA
jgi:predicted MFS family arabinose efflux permease